MVLLGFHTHLEGFCFLSISMLSCCSPILHSLYMHQHMSAGQIFHCFNSIYSFSTTSAIFLATDVAIRGIYIELFPLPNFMRSIFSGIMVTAAVTCIHVTLVESPEPRGSDGFLGGLNSETPPSAIHDAL